MSNESLSPTKPAAPPEVDRWRDLALRLEVVLDCMPYAERDRNELLGVVDRLTINAIDQACVRNRLDLLRALRRNDLQRGQELARRLTAFARATFGDDDERLELLGLKRRPQRPHPPREESKI